MGLTLEQYATGRDNNFNVLRFIAATLVLYTHSYALVFGSASAEPLRAYLGLTWGDIAVDVFFVSSGFLIAASFFVRSNLLAFVWARVLRIYPALFAAVLLSVFGVGVFFTTLELTEYLLSRQTYSYLLKNMSLLGAIQYTLPGVFESLPYKNAVNGSLWTLPFELRMYGCLALIGSLLLFLSVKFKKDILPAAFAGIAILAVCLNIANYFVPFTGKFFLHLFAMFFVGAAFYLLKAKIVLRFDFFCLAVVLMGVGSVKQEGFMVVYTLLLPYVLFYLAYVPKGVIRQFNRVGDYSYGIYIYAFPVQQSLVALWPKVTVGELIIYSFVITLALAVASWHLLEKKCLALKSSYVVLERFLGVGKDKV